MGVQEPGFSRRTIPHPTNHAPDPSEQRRGTDSRSQRCTRLPDVVLVRSIKLVSRWCCITLRFNGPPAVCNLVSHQNRRGGQTAVPSVVHRLGHRRPRAHHARSSTLHPTPETKFGRWVLNSYQKQICKKVLSGRGVRGPRAHYARSSTPNPTP